MKKPMTKKEILEALNEGIGLFVEVKDEDTGEVYMKDFQFKEAEDLLRQLKKKIKILEERTKKFEDIIHSKKNFTVIITNQMTHSTIKSPNPVIIFPRFFRGNILPIK